MKSFSFYLAACVLAFAGCTHESQEQDFAAPPAPLAHFVTNTPTFESPEARAAYGAALGEVSPTIYELMQAATIEDAQRQGDAIIADASEGNERAIAEQLVAQALLSTWMSREEATPAFTATYLEPLLEHGTPNPALVVSALEKLTPYWSKAQMHEAVRRATEATLAALRKETTCNGCTRGQIEERLWGTEGRRSQALQMQASLKRLDRLSS